MNKTNIIFFLLLAVINNTNIDAGNDSPTTTAISPSATSWPSDSYNKKQQLAFDISKEEIKRITRTYNELSLKQIQDSQTANPGLHVFSSLSVEDFTPQAYSPSIAHENSDDYSQNQISDNNSISSTQSYSLKSTPKPLAKVRLHQKTIKMQMIKYLSEELAASNAHQKKREACYEQKLLANKIEINKLKESGHCKLMATTCSLGLFTIALWNEKQN